MQAEADETVEQEIEDDYNGDTVNNLSLSTAESKILPPRESREVSGPVSKKAKSSKTTPSERKTPPLDSNAKRNEASDLQSESEPEIEDQDQVPVDENAGELLKGFDSDAEDKDYDSTNEELSTRWSTSDLPSHRVDKNTKNKLKKAAANADDEPGAVYVGRIPHGFYEHQMRQYFSQFGDITRLRLSRNRQTGASKHYAFIEFKSSEVAKIVATTMDSYLMFGHILRVKYAPPETLHSDVWKGSNKRFRIIPYNKLEKRKLEEPKTVAKWDKKAAREQSRREEKLAKMKELGYEYELPVLKSATDVVEKRGLLASTDEVAEAMSENDIEQLNTIIDKAEKKARKKRAADEIADAAIDEEVEVAAPFKKKSRKDTKKAIESADPPTPTVTPTFIEQGEKVGKKRKDKKSKAEDGEKLVEPTRPSTNATASATTEQGDKVDKKKKDKKRKSEDAVSTEKQKTKAKKVKT